MFLTWHKILAKKNNKILQFSAVVICNNQYDEFLFFNCSKNSTHLKIMVPGLRGPAGGPCKSGDITGWGLNVFMAIILPIWTIYSNSPIWNIISETHLVLNSQNFILLHTASGLRYYGSKLWNILPHWVKNTKDMNVFKKNITEWCHSRQCIALDVF